MEEYVWLAEGLPKMEGLVEALRAQVAADSARIAARDAALRIQDEQIAVLDSLQRGWRMEYEAQWHRAEREEARKRRWRWVALIEAGLLLLGGLFL